MSAVSPSKSSYRAAAVALELAKTSPRALTSSAARALMKSVASSKAPLDECVALLKEIAADTDAPEEERDKARRALKAISEGKEPEETHDDAGDDDDKKAKGAASRPLLNPEEAAMFERGNAAIRNASRGHEDKRAESVRRANEIARANSWPEVR